MKQILILIIALFGSLSSAVAQKSISGRVTDARTKEPLIGASVVAKGTTQGTLTDIEGKFQVVLPNGNSLIVISFVGYNPQEMTVGTESSLEIELSESSVSMDNVVVLGSRSTSMRTRTETVAPVDVLNSKDLIATGQTEPTQMMHFIAPSFNSARQTVADGTDHIDPATLRGLGPDQVLVLLNGKRRHNQALININGTVGRGSVGTDMNAIPAAAIDRMEVLRDGASSQYGSDAIGGVINVVMKNSPGSSISAHYGSYNTEYQPVFGQTSTRRMTDGENLQISGYHGMKVGKGKLSVALEFRDRKPSNRVGDFLGTVYNGTKSVDDPLVAAKNFDRTFNMQIGNAASQNLLGFLSFSYPIGENGEFYLNAGGASRKGAGKGFYRYPKQTTQVNLALYPNGFLPEIHSTIMDISALVGVKGMIGDGWRWDLSNVYGSNDFRYDVKNSNNASQFALGTAAPTSFYAGTQKFAQNTLNLDISKSIATTAVKSLNVAFGAEYRMDMFGIEAGEDASWKNYDLTAVPLRVGGAQVFPGFQPSNAVDKSRSVMGAYLDVETDINEKLLIDAAIRAENYSDFGSNAAGKLAARYKIADELVFRGAVSTGFRAPSIHQRYFSNTSTQFVVANGVTTPNNVGTYRNDSEIAKALGIPTLQAETSNNLSFGITSKLDKLVTITADLYQIDINNRIVMTGNMSRSNATINSLLTAAGAAADVTTVAFFTNAISTRTSGIDVVVGLSPKLGKGVLDLMAAANFTENKIIGGTKTTDKLPADQFGKTFFGRLEESRIVVGQPRQKISLSATYRVNNFNANVRSTHFGAVSVWDNSNIALDEKFGNKTITDLSFGYKFKVATLTLGANNVLDVYPDKLKNYGGTSDGRFIYSRNATQFGFSGRYLYANLRVDLK
jgi:iron complex outermembrane recepter protein